MPKKFKIHETVFRKCRRGEWIVHYEILHPRLGHAGYTFNYPRWMEEQQVRQMSEIKLRNVLKNAEKDGKL